MIRLTNRLPERRFAIALVLRASFVWLVLRIIVGAAHAVVSGSRTQKPWVLTIPTAVFLVAMVGGLGVLDARRRNEDRFLANLGVSQTVIALLSMAPAAVIECIIGVVGS